MQKLPPLLAISYFSPIYFYKQLTNCPVVYIENDENYLKQTYRNRCEIYAANGKLSLSIPVQKLSNQKTNIRDIKISYEINWQKQHLKSIESAYSSSPFYEFYMDDFLDFFIKNTEFLFDLNLKIIETVNKILNISPIIRFSDNFVFDTNNHFQDFRNLISPKNESYNASTSINFDEYKQVFSVFWT